MTMLTLFDLILSGFFVGNHLAGDLESIVEANTIIIQGWSRRGQLLGISEAAGIRKSLKSRAFGGVYLNRMKVLER